MSLYIDKYTEAREITSVWKVIWRSTQINVIDVNLDVDDALVI